MREKLRREKTHESKLHMLVRAKGSSHQTWTWTWLRAVCLGYSRNFHMEFSHDVNIVSPGIGKMIVNSNFITGRLIFPPSFGPCVCKDFPCYWFFSIQLRWEIAAKFAGRERDKARRKVKMKTKTFANTWPVALRAGNYHHQLISGFPGSNCGYFEWTGCKRTCHTHTPGPDHWARHLCTYGHLTLCAGAGAGSPAERQVNRPQQVNICQ